MRISGIVICRFGSDAARRRSNNVALLLIRRGTARSWGKLRIQHVSVNTCRERFYDIELSHVATFRNVLGQVIKRARGLLFYRGLRHLKKMVSFGGGRSAEFKRPSQRIFLSREADRSCYTGLSGPVR